MTAGNTLLEQPPESTTLELTLHGGSWELTGRGQIALTGADMDWRLDGVSVNRYETIDLKGCHELRGRLARRGCRAYLCVRGDWDLPSIMGSVEPGLPGTALPGQGTSVSIASASQIAFRSAWWADKDFAREVTLRVHPGPEWRLLDESQKRFLETQRFAVGAASDRQGIRLSVSDYPTLSAGGILSSPVLPGTVQWTPSGLILLGPDAQTVGGYPRVLVAVAMPAGLFQLRPGDELRFELAKAGL